MSPFIVTTKRAPIAANPFASFGSFAKDSQVTQPRVVSCRAVASLEEAAKVIYTAAGQQTTPSDWSYDQCLCKLPDSGGSVGPLPDGTVIEVEAKSWFELMDDVMPHVAAQPTADWRPAILAAFNAREAAR